MDYGQVGDGLRARYAPASGGLYYLFQWDPQGSLVQRQTGGTGGNTYYYALDTAMYDGYGAKLGDTDAYTGNPEAPTRDAMGFQGQFGAYTDNETGLVLMGHRYYDAGTGRFLTRDPKGYGGGINLYGFTGNNPVNESDSNGTDPPGNLDEWYNSWDNTTLSDAWDSVKRSVTENGNLRLARHAFSEVYNAYDHYTDLSQMNDAGPPSSIGGATAASSVSIFAKDKAGNNNVTEWRRRIRRSDIASERTKFLGDKYVKIEPGKWRSADGLRQFRVKPQDFRGLHPIGMPSVSNTPHVHFEFLRPVGKAFKVIKNIHVPIIP